MVPKLNSIVVNTLWISIYILKLSAIYLPANNNTKKRSTYSASVSKIFGIEDFLINTESCSIPNYIKTMSYKEPMHKKNECGTRLVFMIKTAIDEVAVVMDFAAFPKNTRAYTCYYQFVTRSTKPGEEDYSLTSSEWNIFENGDKIKLKEEIIKVNCEMLHYELVDPDNFTISSYKDAYLILKKKPTPLKQHSENAFNIILIGIDSTSRGRAYNSFPKVVSYFKKQEWLDFRGYNKIGRNTYPNMMAILAGINPNTKHQNNIEFYRNKLIWNRFKDRGYMTAYGEDGSTYTLKGFKKQPTDHYARPFSLLGHNKSGDLICLSSKSSNLVILNYAKQFIKAYKDNRFFGLFWFSTFTHEPTSLPRASEKMLLDFLKDLKGSGVVHNTFIVFFSDHGINFGPNAISTGSYYDSRLPMLFMWVPLKFRKIYKKEYFNLKVNQLRLTTPFDLHATLWQILKISDQNKAIEPPEACPNCKGLFSEVSKHRTCADVNISLVYCTCHEMINTKNTSKNYKLSLAKAVNYINKKAALINTKECYNCHPLELKSVIKSNFYKIGHETIFVILSNFSPINITYELIVRKSGGIFTAINSRALTPIERSISVCVFTEESKEYCVCQYNGCNITYLLNN